MISGRNIRDFRDNVTKEAAVVICESLKQLESCVQRAIDSTSDSELLELQNEFQDTVVMINETTTLLTECSRSIIGFYEESLIEQLKENK